jgi:cellulase/cellobiase CelA1
LAKHRVIVPPSFRSVVVLAVLGAVAAAVILAVIDPGPPKPSRAAAPQPKATAAPASPAGPAPTSAGPSGPTVFASAAAVPLSTPADPAGPRPSATRRPPTPAAPQPALTARYVVTMSRGDGFIAGFEVANTGGQAAQWTVEITYAGQVQVAQPIWNATVERTGDTYRFRAKSGSALGPAQKVQFGYSASGPTGSSRPVRCTINGRACVS